jgi:hypothetical protein
MFCLFAFPTHDHDDDVMVLHTCLRPFGPHLSDTTMARQMISLVV